MPHFPKASPLVMRVNSKGRGRAAGHHRDGASAMDYAGGSNLGTAVLGRGLRTLSPEMGSKAPWAGGGAASPISVKRSTGLPPLGVLATQGSPSVPPFPSLGPQTEPAETLQSLE